MKPLGGAIVVLCVFALSGISAFAQPFADVPTNHWAYDAIAELAAKGLVEGYPDGTFKGDRAMTRYEMAMIVARLLSRIESIQIPAPAPAPQVTKADLDALQRLINEFRAELAALGVRVTAIEEELNAIKARLDNVKITGRYRFRYDGGPTQAGPNITGTCARGTTLNGNGNTCTVDLGTSPTTFRARQGLKLMIDGSVAPDIHAIIGLELATGASGAPAVFDGAGYALGGVGGAGSGCNGGTTCYQLGNIAELYLDWNHAWGWPVHIQLGRMGWIQQSFSSADKQLQFGPRGLLVNTSSDTYGASNGNSGTQIWDGLRLSDSGPPWADFKWQAAVWRVLGPTGGTTYLLGEDAWGGDASLRILGKVDTANLRIGGYYVANNINPASPVFPTNATSALWHVYGNPVTPLSNPPTSVCPAVGNGILPAAVGGGNSQGGIECHALGSGGGAYVTWNVIPGPKPPTGPQKTNIQSMATPKAGSASSPPPPVVQFDGEIATWNDGVAGTSDSAYYVDAALNLDLSSGRSLKLTLSYENAGVNFYAPYQNDVDSAISATVGPGNAQGFTADLLFRFSGLWAIKGAYFSGNNTSNGMGITEYRLGVIWQFVDDQARSKDKPNDFTQGGTIYTRMENQHINGISQYTFYRCEIAYTF